MQLHYLAPFYRFDEASELLPRRHRSRHYALPANCRRRSTMSPLLLMHLLVVLHSHRRLLSSHFC